MRINVIIVSIFALVWTGCIKDNNPTRPAYIEVESIGFSVDSSGSQGTASSNIKDAWVSVDGQLLGTNTLPNVSFPTFLNENIVTNAITVRAGIEVNGIANTRRTYPFYAPYTVAMDLEPGQVVSLSPILQYDSLAKIIIVEDFEPTGTVFSDDRDGNANTYIERQNIEVFEGNYSGKILLDSNNIECIASTAVKYTNLQLTNVASAVYLEMDYKTNNIFSVGLVKHYSNNQEVITYLAGVNPRDDWNKIYFDLTEEVFSAGTNQFSILFRALKNIDEAVPEIYVDNIKIVHF